MWSPVPGGGTTGPVGRVGFAEAVAVAAAVADGAADAEGTVETVTRGVAVSTGAETTPPGDPDADATPSCTVMKTGAGVGGAAVDPLPSAK